MVKDTEDYWSGYFRTQGETYTAPKVLFGADRVGVWRRGHVERAVLLSQ